MDSVFGTLVAAGFLALFALPALLVGSALVRLLWIGWRPRDLALVEEGGGAPRLAGWVAVVVLGALALAWVMFQGTWVLANWTAFKPLPTSFVEPLLAVGATLTLVLASRPAARGFAALARGLDARWRRRGHDSLVTPIKIAFATVVAGTAIVAVIWYVVVKPQIGELDLDVLRAPAVGIVAAALVHVGWQRAPHWRWRGGAALGAVTLLAIASALFAWRARPSLTLAVWGDRPLAGLAVDVIFDLDAVRAEIPLAEFRPTERPGARHPDIVLVTIDTVRADHTPPYGGNAEMPVLRELGARGAVFDWAFAPSNVTRRSIPSMILGLAPNRVRGRVVGWALRFDPRYVLLAERLEAGGYETAGFVCCEGLWGKSFRTGWQRGLEHLEIEPNGQALARRARAWLDERAHQPHTKPLFLWVHVLEPHNWQSASGEPRNDDERRKFYDRSLQLSDGMLVELFGAFSHRPPDEAPIVIVSADHGEGLGDHGQPFHSTDLYDSQIRVPLVIAGPGIKPGHVVETVSLTDLTPTLIDLAGFVPPKGAMIDGRSVADLATGARASNPEGGIAFAAMIKDRSNPGGLTAIVEGRWKLIDNGSSLELYDTRVDPDERSNLLTSHPSVIDHMKKLLKKHQDAASVSPF